MEPRTLMELSEMAQYIDRQLVESGGEITPEIDQLITQLELAVPQKVDGYNVVIERLENQMEYVKTHIDSMTKYRRAISSTLDRLKSNIKNYMVVNGKKEVLGHETRFVLTSAKEKLVVDESLIPENWKMTVTERVADKERIKDALSLGITITGAKLEGGYGLRTYRKGMDK